MLSRAPRGFSLVELLVAMALGLFLLGGVLQLFSGLLEMDARLLRRLRLQQELRAVMSIMARDIRRSAAWRRGAISPLAAPRVPAGEHCLLYGYDADGNGHLDNTENLGFRLYRGSVAARRKASSCRDTCDCAGGRWWRLSDPDLVRITTLRFRPLSGELPLGGGRRLRRQALEITLAGRLRRFPGERLELRGTVFLPNVAQLAPAP